MIEHAYTDLGICLANKSIASDKMRHYPLRPGLNPLAIVEGHHQLPQMRLTALFEVLQDAALCDRLHIGKNLIFVSHRGTCQDWGYALKSVEPECDGKIPQNKCSRRRAVEVQ